MPFLAILQAAQGLISAVTTLIPEVQQNIAQGKAVLNADEAAAVNAAIVQLHSDTLALTAKLDQMREA